MFWDPSLGKIRWNEFSWMGRTLSKKHHSESIDLWRIKPYKQQKMTPMPGVCGWQMTSSSLSASFPSAGTRSRNTCQQTEVGPDQRTRISGPACCSVSFICHCSLQLLSLRLWGLSVIMVIPPLQRGLPVHWDPEASLPSPVSTTSINQCPTLEPKLCLQMVLGGDRVPWDVTC